MCQERQKGQELEQNLSHRFFLAWIRAVTTYSGCRVPKLRRGWLASEPEQEDWL